MAQPVCRNDSFIYLTFTNDIRFMLVVSPSKVTHPSMGSQRFLPGEPDPAVLADERTARVGDLEAGRHARQGRHYAGRAVAAVAAAACRRSAPAALAHTLPAVHLRARRYGRLCFEGVGEGAILK